jgi:RNA polymerase sigma-70 factor (ECF subfamily)
MGGIVSTAGAETCRFAELLNAVNVGSPGAADRLALAVQGELRAMANKHLTRKFGRAMAGITIQPTVLADDTLMKLLRQRQQFDNAGHFFAIATRLMVRALLDYHRERNAKKRGRGGALRVSLSPDLDAAAVPRAANDDVDVEALNGALKRLAALDSRKADVVKYRVFWEFTVSQAAEALGTAVTTVERDWAFAKAWLAKELKGAVA